MNGAYPLQALAERADRARRLLPLVRHFGEVVAVTPSAITVCGLSHLIRVGSHVDVRGEHASHLAEIVRLDRGQATAKLFEPQAGIALGSRVYPAHAIELFPHESWQGRVLDAMGRPADGGPELRPGLVPAPLDRAPPDALARGLVHQPVVTGVRAIDAFMPVCFGQRIGIFAGSGVGKSTLLSMLTRADGFDAIVVALVGERGREVREFVQETLGAMARRSVVVVSTGGESAMMRRMAPLSATAIAECFRDQGRKVLLVMDSVTRYALACRDVALSAGEPPVARGFPPSVFSALPRLLERAGPGSGGEGSITGIYAVLVDGDDHNDPVADAIRGTLDGHIVLDRTIAETGRYPAIDLLASVSRLSHKVWRSDQRQAVVEMRKLVARFEESRDLRAMGGVVAGADPELDRATALVPKLYGCLTQGPGEGASEDAFKDIAAALSGGG